MNAAQKTNLMIYQSADGGHVARQPNPSRIDGERVATYLVNACSGSSGTMGQHRKVRSCPPGKAGKSLDRTTPGIPAERSVPICAYCRLPAEGNYSIHRDGFCEGPEVPLCDDCGSRPEPTCEQIWERIKHGR